jgi:hypothetical protein
MLEGIHRRCRPTGRSDRVRPAPSGKRGFAGANVEFSENAIECGVSVIAVPGRAASAARSRCTCNGSKCNQTMTKTVRNV